MPGPSLLPGVHPNGEHGAEPRSTSAFIPTMSCTRFHLGFFQEERESKQEAVSKQTATQLSSELGGGRTPTPGVQGRRVC